MRQKLMTLDYDVVMGSCGKSADLLFLCAATLYIVTLQGDSR